MTDAMQWSDLPEMAALAGIDPAVGGRKPAEYMDVRIAAGRPDGLVTMSEFAEIAAEKIALRMGGKVAA